MITSAESLNNLFVHAKFSGTHFVRTKHVPNKIFIAFLKPIIRFGCATHRDFSQMFHTCFQRMIDSCGSGEVNGG